MRIVGEETGYQLRRAGPDDALALADVWLRSRRASAPSIPPTVHSDGEVREWFSKVVVPRRETWLAERGAEIVGLLVLDGEWIDQLYIDPAHTGRGVGSRLVDLAKLRRGEGLDLWTFQSNLRARRFYERHGFIAVSTTDGDNEEEEPDVRYHWSA